MKYTVTIPKGNGYTAALLRTRALEQELRDVWGFHATLTDDMTLTYAAGTGEVGEMMANNILRNRYGVEVTPAE